MIGQRREESLLIGPTSVLKRLRGRCAAAGDAMAFCSFFGGEVFQNHFEPGSAGSGFQGLWRWEALGLAGARWAGRAGAGARPAWLCPLRTRGPGTAHRAAAGPWPWAVVVGPGATGGMAGPPALARGPAEAPAEVDICPGLGLWLGSPVSSGRAPGAGQGWRGTAAGHYLAPSSDPWPGSPVVKQFCQCETPFSLPWTAAGACPLKVRGDGRGWIQSCPGSSCSGFWHGFASSPPWGSRGVPCSPGELHWAEAAAAADPGIWPPRHIRVHQVWLRALLQPLQVRSLVPVACVHRDHSCRQRDQVSRGQPAWSSQGAARGSWPLRLVQSAQASAGEWPPRCFYFNF